MSERAIDAEKLVRELQERRDEGNAPTDRLIGFDFVIDWIKSGKFDLPATPTAKTAPEYVPGAEDFLNEFYEHERSFCETGCRTIDDDMAWDTCEYHLKLGERIAEWVKSKAILRGQPASERDYCPTCEKETCFAQRKLGWSCEHCWQVKTPASADAQEGEKK